MEFYNLQNRYNNHPVLIDDNANIFTKDDFNILNEKIKNSIPSRALVFLFCENSIDSISIYIALLNNRIVPVMLSYELDDKLKYELIELYKPQFIITKQSYFKAFTGYENVLISANYDFLKTNYNIRHNLNEELALLLTTSGSTGSPKLVRQSYKNINSNANSIVKYLKLNDKERPITVLPFNYTYGISVINSHLLIGATILVTNKTVIQREFWNFVKEYGATSISGVPYTYQMLKKMKFLSMDLPTIKTMTQAGGKLALNLHQDFADYAKNNDKKFIVMYGQTEATARMGYLPHDKALDKIGSMGIAIPDGRFELLDENNNIITQIDTVGELVYYGDNVTLGYSECIKDLSKGDERFGRLLTGDMAKFDIDGYYYIVGRKKRFLKIFGNRVNLDEIEQMLTLQFKENEFACSGKDDNMNIYYTGDIDVSILSNFISNTLKLNKKAFNFINTDTIAKNESGKTLYSLL